MQLCMFHSTVVDQHQVKICQLQASATLNTAFCPRLVYTSTTGELGMCIAAK